MSLGKQLAHFKITDKLGEGGMGEVYRAEDSKLGREVAIKLLPDEVVDDAERLARFQREAKLLASLNHPNIAAIYGIEEAEGKPLLVLELIEGETLAERIEQGPMSVGEVLEIGRQIALALEAAHAKGVVHRDLKPANVKLTPAGSAKVLDFGLAKAWDVDEASGSSPMLTRSPTLTQGMTEAGVLLGTAAYMSPEQARGKPVDKRADIWAFGCVLLEMLTGRKAFGGDTVTDMIAAVVAREPEWSTLPTATPPDLVRLLRRCLEKDEDKRLRDIGDARIELEELLENPQPRMDLESGVEPVAASRRWIVATAAAGALALVLALGLWRASIPETPQVVRAYVPAPEGGEFNLGSDFPGPVAVSPDGRSLAFGVRLTTGTEQLWVRDLDDLQARPLAGTEGALYPFWSPDGRYIGFFSSGKLKKIEATGGPAMSLCDAANGKGGTWNEDDVIVFAPSHNLPLHRVSAAGGEAAVLTEFNTEAGEDSHRHPRFLPDGEHFLFVARAAGGAGANSQVMIGSLDGETRSLMPATSNVEYHNGHLLYVFEQTLMARPFDARKLEIVGDAFPIAEEIYVDQGAMLGVYSGSAGGTLAYQSGTPREAVQSTIEWRDRTGELAGDLGPAESFGEVHLAPDDRTAMVGRTDPESSNYDLWLVDLERQLKTRFTFDAGQDQSAAWSPDGDRVAFTMAGSATPGIYVKSISGGGDEKLLLEVKAPTFPTSWSPDGRYLVYESVGSQGSDMYYLDLVEGGEPVVFQKTEFNDTVPVISPDGRWLAYSTDESGRWEVYVTSFPDGGRKWQVSASGGDFPRWRQDGEELFFLTPEGMLVVAQVDGSSDTFRVGGLDPLFELGAYTGGYDYDVSADGQRFLINKALDTGRDQSQLPMTLVYNWTADLDGR